MNPNPQSNSSNFHQSELDKFAALANRWWDVDGPQKPLHALNPVRLQYVAQRVALRGARVLDIGCGGGLLSEALAKEGADVTAIDLAPELVKVDGGHVGAGLGQRFAEQAAAAADVEHARTAQRDPVCNVLQAHRVQRVQRLLRTVLSLIHI